MVTSHMSPPWAGTSIPLFSALTSVTRQITSLTQYWGTANQVRPPSINGPVHLIFLLVAMDTITQLQDKLHDMTKRLAHEIRFLLVQHITFMSIMFF
jgi:hypothetical protein